MTAWEWEEILIWKPHLGLNNSLFNSNYQMYFHVRDEIRSWSITFILYVEITYYNYVTSSKEDTILNAWLFYQRTDYVLRVNMFSLFINMYCIEFGSHIYLHIFSDFRIV